MRHEPQQQRLEIPQDYEIYTWFDLPGLYLAVEMKLMEIRLVLEMLGFH